MERALKVGCGCLLLVMACCVLSFFLGPRLIGMALPDPEAAAERDPLDIEGECTRDAVAMYLDETGPRLEALFAPLEGWDQQPGTHEERLRSIDVPALQAARDELASLEVAPCLRAMRDEEVALANAVIDVMASLQAEDQMSGLDGIMAIWKLLRTVPPSIGRISDASDRLRLRYGIPTATPEPVATGFAP